MPTLELKFTIVLILNVPAWMTSRTSGVILMLLQWTFRDLKHALEEFYLAYMWGKKKKHDYLLSFFTIH